MNWFRALVLGIMIFVFSTASAHKQRIDHKLQKKLEELTADFKGTVGVYVYNLKTGKEDYNQY